MLANSNKIWDKKNSENMASLCIILITVYINMFCVLKKGDVSFMLTKHMFDRERLKIIFFFFFWGGGGVRRSWVTKC